MRCSLDDTTVQTGSLLSTWTRVDLCEHVCEPVKAKQSTTASHESLVAKAKYLYKLCKYSFVLLKERWPLARRFLSVNVKFHKADLLALYYWSYDLFKLSIVH